MNSQVLNEEAILGTERGRIDARLLPLDALRGVAIFLVVFHHAGWRFPLAPRGWLGSFIFSIGWGGVDLFFAISGYLITTILLRSSGKQALRGFYIKRFFRIVPLYAVALSLFIVVSVMTGSDYGVLRRIWVDFLFLTGWFIPFVGENGVPYTITWSLSVEEFAYLLFGLIAFVAAHRFRLSLYWIIVAALALRIVSVVFFAFEPITLYYFAPGRIDSIAFGGLAATAAPSVVNRLSVPPWIPGLAWMAVMGVLALLKREAVIVATLGYSVLSVVSAWLVLSIANLPKRESSLLTKWMAKLGLVSYFVYLFHVFVIGALAILIPPEWLPRLNVWYLALAALVLTFVPALISWKIFEYPMIRVGRRIAHSNLVAFR